MTLSLHLHFCKFLRKIHTFVSIEGIHCDTRWSISYVQPMFKKIVYYSRPSLSERNVLRIKEIILQL